jgi:biotin carboxyl carrier protein
MQYEVEVGGRLRQVAVVRGPGDGFAVTVDGVTRHVDIARIDAHLASLIVDGVRPDATRRSHEVTIAAVPGGDLAVRVGDVSIAATFNGRRRWRIGHSGSAERGLGTAGGAASGPQRVTAPMPGKVVRVLVKPGDAVAARQPVVVVEAMKMENELRAGREGTVSDVQVREGMSVDAGALLLVIQ